MTTPLLTTKLYVPPVRPELVPRPRLVERLNEGTTRKLFRFLGVDERFRPGIKLRNRGYRALKRDLGAALIDPRRFYIEFALNFVGRRRRYRIRKRSPISD